MKNLIIYCALIVFFTGAVNAHNPLAAMYYFEVVDSIGILNIKLSQAGLHAALEKAHPDEDITALSGTAYKKLAAGYLKENFALTINQQPVPLLEGGIKLGSHQTDIKYITSTIPGEIVDLSVSIPAFKENEYHQTIFSISHQGETDKIILNEHNDFSESVTFLNGQIVSQQIHNWQLTLWASVSLLLLIILLGFIRNRRPLLI